MCMEQCGNRRRGSLKNENCERETNSLAEYRFSYNFLFYADYTPHFAIFLCKKKKSI